MNSKKIVLTLTAFALTGLFLTACSAKKDAENKGDIDGKETTDYKKDAIDQKSKVVDGKEVTEYTMSDGSVIQVPAGEEAGQEDATDGSSEE